MFHLRGIGSKLAYSFSLGVLVALIALLIRQLVQLYGIDAAQEGLLVEAISNLSGITITVFIIDRLAKIRAKKEATYVEELARIRTEKELFDELVLDMGGESNEFAKRAVRRLRAKGYLTSGALRGKDFKGANLRNADLSGADLESANFDRAQIEGADLSQANLANVKMRYTNLRESNLGMSNLVGSLLTGADLELAILRGTNLEDSDLGFANLKHADMDKASLKNATVSQELDGATLPDHTMWSKGRDLRDFTDPNGLYWTTPYDDGA